MPTLTAKQNGNYKVNGYNTLHVNVQPSGGGGTAASISYDNTISALSATNVQAAIDELASDISAISVPDPSSTTPLMDGVATVGSEVRFARGDHVHPSDTSRVPTSRTINGYALTSNITLSASDVGALADSTVVPTPSSTTPLMDGTASVGSEDAYARGDHVHPHDTSKVDVAGDTMTGTLKVIDINSTNDEFKEVISAVTKNDVLAIDSTLTSSSTIAAWQTALLKAICVKYPNRTTTVFKGHLQPSSQAWYEVFIYDTSNLSNGLPQYSFGLWRQYSDSFVKFGTVSYAFGSANVDTNTTYSAGTDLTLSGTTIDHDDSGVTAGTKGTNSTTALTPAFGGTFNVIGLAVNARGHITSANSHTVKIPNSAATTSAAGLMTTTQVTKLNGIATGANKSAFTETTVIIDIGAVSSHSYKSGTKSFTKPSGYTHAIIVGYYITGTTRNHMVNLYSIYLNSAHTSATVRVANMDDSTATSSDTKVEVYLAWFNF